MEILNIKIDNSERCEILEKVKFFLNKDGFHQIATINPEFILLSQKDNGFKEIINSCQLNIPDGFGITLAALICGEKLKHRMAGVDLADQILKMADEKRMRVYLACRNGGLTYYGEIKKALEKIYPSIAFFGGDIDHLGKKDNITIDSSDILLCNFGTPWQEKFINRQKNGRIRLAMGVGGAFDFWCGKVRRAPIWMRKIGLEWVWRLIQQPRRFSRIFRSVAVFPLKVILSKLGIN